MADGARSYAARPGGWADAPQLMSQTSIFPTSGHWLAWRVVRYYLHGRGIPATAPAEPGALKQG